MITQPRLARPPASVLRWVLLLGAAEAVGMTAAAGAAKAGQALVGEPTSAGGMAVVLGLATAAGLVEGGALAGAMAAALRPIAPELPARRWVVVTLLVAGLGWLAGSLPGVLAGSGGGSGEDPPLAFVLAGAAAIGLVMGAALGAAQALVLRHHLRHAWRWAGASALAWTPAMTVIFLGATWPGSDWTAGRVTGIGALTGAVAGACLGLVLGLGAASLQGPPVSSRVVLRLLRTPARRMLPNGLVGLAVRGRVTGDWHRFPVMAAPDGENLVVLPGHPEAKQWWRNLVRPSQVQVCRDGDWLDADAWLLQRDSHGYAPALQAYRRRFGLAVSQSPPLVRIVLRPQRDRAATGQQHEARPAGHRAGRDGSRST